MSVGNLDAHKVLAWDAINAHGFGFQRQRQVIFHAQHSRKGHAGIRLKFVDRDDRARLHSYHQSLYLEFGEFLANEIASGFQVFGLVQPLMQGRGVEEPTRRKFYAIRDGIKNGLQFSRSPHGMNGGERANRPSQRFRRSGFHQRQGLLLGDTTVFVGHGASLHQRFLGWLWRWQIPEQRGLDWVRQSLLLIIRLRHQDVRRRQIHAFHVHGMNDGIGEFLGDLGMLPTEFRGFPLCP